MLPFASSDKVNLVDLYRARKGQDGGGLYHPTSEVLGRLLRIIFVEAEFMSDLTVARIRLHQRQPGDPDPQQLVASRKHRPGQVIKLLPTC